MKRHLNQFELQEQFSGKRYNIREWEEQATNGHQLGKGEGTFFVRMGKQLLIANLNTKTEIRISFTSPN